MKIYNTLTKQKEELKTVIPGHVGIYACGPTVYDYIHIGNARPLCVFDVLRRYLEWRGYKVTFVQNFTDIDDKLINRAARENTTVPELAQKYIAEYFKDAEGLNIKPATFHPKASENIGAIIELISTLMEKGYAYKTEEGVFFRTGRFKDYGKLSHQSLDELEAGARIDVSESKENPMDFALWKAAKPGEPFWDSPFGKGRPGWHIECSAMSMRYLGKTFDIHCGGQDLIFPHHENEIAQSEAAGCEFARYWMHNGYINIDGSKMSKSLGNFFTVREIAEKYGYEPIRFLLISAHYRSPINYSTEIIGQSQNALERLYNCREGLVFAMSHAPEGEGEPDFLQTRRQEFIDALEDDFNISDALAALFNLVRDINTLIKQNPNRGECKACLDLFDELCSVLGLLYNRQAQTLDTEIEELIQKRAKARKEKDFATADKIRDQLKEMGIILEDTPHGTKWSKVND